MLCEHQISEREMTNGELYLSIEAVEQRIFNDLDNGIADSFQHQRKKSLYAEMNKRGYKTLLGFGRHTSARYFGHFETYAAYCIGV